MPHRFTHVWRFPLAVLLLVAGVLAAAPGAAFTNAARRPLTGELEWRFADYSSDASAGEDFTASHFTQKYSFKYNLAGNIYGSRGGMYNVGLGFEWWRLDAEFGDDDISLSDFKPLYEGELLLAPAALPLRLRLYAHDLGTVTFATENYSPGVIDSNIITDAYGGGENLTIGGTLIAGLSNRGYYNDYRDALASVPKLYLDFRQTTVRNYESEEPDHYRERSLAFASLNKKDNWVHYRSYEFKDYIDDEDSFSWQTVQLGTVDYRLDRRWIWLTNWLSLSTDASFTTTDEFRDNRGEPEHLFDYNLFLAARRDNFTFSNFNTFTRETDADELHKTLEVPFFLTYRLDPDRLFRGQLSLESEENIYERAVQSDNSYDDLYLFGKLETGLTKPVRIDPAVELELLEGKEFYGSGQSVRGSVETYSNPRFRRDRDWLVSYALANFRGNDTTGEDVNFVEQEATVSASRDFTPSLRAGGSQRLIFGTGELDTGISRHLSPASQGGLYGSVDSVDRADGDVLQATTELFLSYRRGQLGNRFEAIIDYLNVSQQESLYTVDLTHRLDYQQRSFRLRMTNSLRFGDGLGSGGFSGDEVDVTSLDQDGDILFEHRTVADYAPSRAWSVKGELNYYWEGGGSNDSGLLQVHERAHYAFFHNRGILRRWLAFGQELTYEQSWDSLGNDSSYGDFSLGCTYYPTRTTYLRSDIGYEFYDPGETIMTYGLGMGVDFPRFKVEASYEYGFSEDDDGSEVKDHRWELIVKKLI